MNIEFVRPKHNQDQQAKVEYLASKELIKSLSQCQDYSFGLPQESHIHLDNLNPGCFAFPQKVKLCAKEPAIGDHANNMEVAGDRCLRHLATGGYDDK